MKKTKTKTKTKHHDHSFNIDELFNDVFGNARVIMQCKCGMTRELTEHESMVFDFAYSRGVRFGRSECVSIVATTFEKLRSQDVVANYLLTSNTDT